MVDALDLLPALRSDHDRAPMLVSTSLQPSANFRAFIAVFPASSPLPQMEANGEVGWRIPTSGGHNGNPGLLLRSSPIKSLSNKERTIMFSIKSWFAPAA